MSFIGSFAQGDWIGGLSKMFGGTLGGHIANIARGTQSVSGMFSDMGKQAAIEAPIAIATMGVGSAASAAASGLAKAAQAGAQAGKAVTAGTKIASGASKVLQGVSNFMGGGSLLNIGKNGGAITGGAASITEEAGTKAATSSINGQIVQGGTSVQIGGTKLTAPGISSGSNLKAGPVQIGSKTFTAPGSVKSEILGTKAINTSTTIPGMPATGLPTPPAKTNITSKINGSKIGQGALKVAGQFGIQGALSLISMGAAAKQADAANKVSQQSLLFQRQTYEEQKAEKESFKTSMKQSAQTAYDSALLFGSTLKDSDSNSSLLTSYSTGGTGDYSILTYSSSRGRDKT